MLLLYIGSKVKCVTKKRKSKIFLYYQYGGANIRIYVAKGGLRHEKEKKEK